MKNLLPIVTGVSLALASVSCEKQEDFSPEQNLQVVEVSSAEDQFIQNFIKVFKQDQNSARIVNSIKESITPILFETLFTDINQSGEETDFMRSYLDKISATQRTNRIKATEVWMLNPDKFTEDSSLLFAFAPENLDEKNMSEVKVYDINGRAVYLDGVQKPNTPIIVFENNGFEALKLKTVQMNSLLQQRGLQSSGMQLRHQQMRNSETPQSLEVTKMTKITLQDDKEPWILGAAEMYAITSGIKDEDNSPELNIIPMIYLDYAGVAYQPHQIMLYWEDYQFEAANIQIFEQDDRRNYKDVVTDVASGVTEIADSLSDQPWVGALGSLGSAILQALPDSWYTNDDDYVDSFLTLEKGVSYTEHPGAAVNAVADFEPLTINQN
ncbi:DUF3103 family protein [Aureivirga sp. CE67]|uniref:DUF3103 family protein n=1 Tax=Aureivirga sp. CE67 TaxID=1788983 RepID=UPI0018C9CFA2|nr:DUF3103 family protein [Aureivirga sp. CE67]